VTERYPTITRAAFWIRAQSFTLDGEAVVCGADGIAVFDTQRRHGPVPAAVMKAFDLLELNGKDLRPLPLSERKAKLARLLAGLAAEIVFNEHTDEDGATVFQQACKMGLEGIVSKRLCAPYRSTDWLKIKNPDSPAMMRARPTLIGNPPSRRINCAIIPGASYDPHCPVHYVFHRTLIAHYGRHHIRSRFEPCYRHRRSTD
jgi:hypothetical protein